MLNQAFLSLGKRRWLKRMVLPILPTIAHLDIEYQNTKGKVFLDLHDFRGPSFYIMYDKAPAFFHYEKQGKDRLFSFIQKRAGTFIDIGSNIGLFSLYFKLQKPDLPILCFEPNDLAFTCLQKTVASFQFSNFHLEKLGIADQAGEIPFYVDNLNSGGHSFIFQHQGNKHVSLSQGQVQTVSLDDYLAHKKIDQISAIKMDVEGFEATAIKGMCRTLKKHRPPLLIECQHASFKEEQNLPKILASAGIEYHVEHIESGQVFKLAEWTDFALKQLEKDSKHELAADYLLF
jgi:FkbM family methyltransferase